VDGDGRDNPINGARSGGWEEAAGPYLKAADDLEVLTDELVAKIQAWSADQAATLRRKAFGLKS
jgi:hypothetical protein